MQIVIQSAIENIFARVEIVTQCKRYFALLFFHKRLLFSVIIKRHGCAPSSRAKRKKVDHVKKVISI